MTISTLIATECLEEAREIAAWFDEEDESSRDEATECVRKLYQDRVAAAAVDAGALDRLDVEQENKRLGRS